MSIKVTLGEAKTQTEKPFPKLMREKRTNDVYYFFVSGCGLPLFNTERSFKDEQFLRDWVFGWNMDAFEDYNGSITLQND